MERIQKTKKVKTQDFRRQIKKKLFLSKCTVRDSKKSRIFKEQETCGLLNIRMKTFFRKILILDDNLFERCKMNEAPNNFFLAGN